MKELDRDFKTQREAASEIQNETEKNRKKIKAVRDRVNSAVEKANAEEDISE